jgi:hypothetical protein
LTHTSFNFFFVCCLYARSEEKEDKAIVKAFKEEFAGYTCQKKNCLARLERDEDDNCECETVLTNTEEKPEPMTTETAVESGIATGSTYN